MNRVALAHLGLAAVQVIYAASYTIAKIVMPQFILPFGFILIRVFAGCTLFWIAHLVFIREKIKREDLTLLMICGIFGAGVNQLTFFKGLSLTTPIDTSLIVTICPIMVLPIAAVLIGERITWRKAIGVFLGAAGAIFLILYGKSVVDNPGENRMLGNFYLFLNATAYAVYLVLVKSLLKKYHPLTIVKWVFTFGLIFVFPFGIQELMLVEWATFTPGAWWAVFYVLFFVTFIAFLFNILALRVVSPAAASAYIYSQPFLATIIAMLAGKDMISLPQVLACLVIFAGLYLVSSKERDKR